MFLMQRKPEVKCLLRQSNAIRENADKLTKEAARGRIGGDEVEAPEIKDEQDCVGPEHGEQVGALHPAEGGASQLRHPHMQ
jgi:hypothetical protein